MAIKMTYTVKSFDRRTGTLWDVFQSEDVRAANEYGGLMEVFYRVTYHSQ